MGSEYSTIKQHEPLRAPKGWGEQEKRFVAQLEEILDDLYSRFGRLKDSDLSKPLRKSIAKSEKGVSELAQTSESFTAAFREIGTIGEPTGETRVDKNGVTVTHKNIGGYTEMNADGLRMHDETGAVIGGMYKSGDEIKSAVQSLINPKYPAFEVTVAPVSYDDEQIGISFKLGDEAVCGIDAYRNGDVKNMFIDSGGSMNISAVHNVRIGNQKGWVSIDDTGFGELGFTDNSGVRHRMTFEGLYKLIGSD